MATVVWHGGMTSDVVYSEWSDKASAHVLSGLIGNVVMVSSLVHRPAQHVCRMHRWRLDATSQKCMNRARHSTSWAVPRWQGTRFSVTLLVGAAKLPLPVLFIHTLSELKYGVLKITDRTSVCLSGLSRWLSWSCLATSHSASLPALIWFTEEQIPDVCYSV